MNNIGSIDASPTKRFFIDMLVRDIALEPAIAELVDNSIDGVKKFRQVTKYEGKCEIDIQFDKNMFCIKDTCGGISISDARDYCFRFGRPDYKISELNDGTGVFGIGMKRALFRMGKEFTVESTTPSEHFKIDVDVDKWLSENDNNKWSFEFTEVNDNLTNEYEKCGTVITVKRLHLPIQNSFESPYFRNTFISYIKSRSFMLNDLNVSIIINGENIEFTDDKILYSNLFKPFVKILELDGVKTKVIAGCARLGAPKKAGWYVQCNGRTVLLANKDETTGWGVDGARAYHASFAAFRGYVLFESSDLEKLPWNTTKTGVDLSSKYYKNAREVMIECNKAFGNWIRKKDDYLEANDLSSSEDIFVGTEINVFSDFIKRNSDKDEDFLFPELNSENFPIIKPLSRITFSVEKDRLENVKEYYDEPRLKNKEIGERVFDYFYEREIEEDE